MDQNVANGVLAQIGDVYRIERKGNIIYWTKNGEQKYTSPEPIGNAGSPLLVDISITKVNSSVYNVNAVSFNNG
ncbi:hypothetical protein RYX45_24525, partial [Alkalihalophilus pseudofirmus]